MWLHKVDNTDHMENLVLSSQNKQDIYKKKMFYWTSFNFSENFHTIKGQALSVLFYLLFATLTLLSLTPFPTFISF